MSWLRLLEAKHILSVLLFALGFSLISTSVTAQAIGSWSITTSFPEPVPYPSCVVSGGFIYCVGDPAQVNGSTYSPSDVFFASLSSAGVGSWTPTTQYPVPIEEESCVASGGFIFCVGGYSGSGLSSTSFTSAVYFASLSSAGVGSWTPTTSYPTTIYDESCVASGNQIYCVGGYPGQGNVMIENAVYFASLSSAGVGSWIAATNYPTPVEGQGCIVSLGFIYCVGGYTGLAAEETKAVYFAPLSSVGVGSWTPTTQYPAQGPRYCIANGNSIYCWGDSAETGAIYYASVSSTGAGPWTWATRYPFSIIDPSCGIANGYIYCVGGLSLATSYGYSDVYFAPISAVTSSTVTVTSTVANTQLQTVDLTTLVVSTATNYLVTSLASMTTQTVTSETPVTSTLTNSLTESFTTTSTSVQLQAMNSTLLVTSVQSNSVTQTTTSTSTSIQLQTSLITTTTGVAVTTVTSTPQTQAQVYPLSDNQLWILSVLLLIGAGAFLFYFKSRTIKKPVTCDKCGTLNPPHAERFCVKCGEPLPRSQD